MITFYPGPSKVYPAVAGFAQEAVLSGVVSLNHRSSGFMDIVKETLRLLHEKLAVPEEYHIFFVSSATECWEIVAQSLTVANSLHPYSGAFGKKWMEYAHRIKPALMPGEADVLCVVQNETSNGTQVRMETLKQFREQFTGLIAVDAVSSLGGLAFDWRLADVWFASVQKCLGLPPGLGLMIYSPAALERARIIGDRQYYNSLLFIHENMEKFQTPYTPNSLGIYLLMRVLQQVPPIGTVDAVLRQRAASWYRFIEEETRWNLLIDQPEHRSDTVIAVLGEEEAIRAVKAEALRAGITIGNGYGDWKNTTFRIANFPAIDESEITVLKDFLRTYGR
ncbi:aminotransferase class V-fold PLP-dependent enzyme [Larkinella soli]|uniref:aminotransferase class V-fold PLP-dependent enzyme n=1 Tax=Larkinella soli TaxID=1770527 RepID=UPI000FFB0B7E|nr:aminotransferase class V-fold PLP-dependent enzyme [Larkinella soli]